MLSPGDLDGIREIVSVFVGAGLDGQAPRDAAELELFALDGIGPFGHPELPEEVLALLPEALASRRDELAAGVLAALAELAPPRLATFAAEERDRLARDGIGSPLAEAVGTLQVRECYRLTLGGGEAEILGALLRRPGDRNVQPAAVIVEYEACGGVVVDGILGEPDKPTAARTRLAEPDPGAVAESIDADELGDALRRALEHMVEHNLELPVDVLPPLLVLRRALGVDWPLPRPGYSESFEEFAREEAEELADAFAAAHGDEAACVADAMCHWKVGAVGGRVDHWTVADVHEFLLEWYPRKGGAGEPIAAVPDTVLLFLRFVADRVGLAGDGIDTLGDAVEHLRARFEREARDRRNWSPAKALAMQMRAEAVDVTDQDAVAAWLAGFNARSFEERDRVVGPSLPRPAPRAKQRPKAHRRATKAARRRNRR